MKKNSHRGLKSAFTIVELLVVIVIIGVLSVIIAVSYAGITNRATVASLSSDLANSSKQLKLFQAENDVYPTAVKCPITLNSEICLKSSSGTTYQYAVNNNTNPKSFSLTATSGELSYNLTNDTVPSPGGRNLLKRSRMDYIPSGTGTGSVKEIVADPIHGNVLHVNAQWVYQANYLSIVQNYQVGDTVKVSFFAKASESVTLRFTLNDSAAVISNMLSANIGTTWGTYTGSAIISRISGSTVNFYYYPDRAGVEYWIKSIKVEKSDNATPWTPAIED